MAVLDIFFRILNFALFAAIIGYYFRSRLLVNIYTQIKAKIASRKATDLAIKQAQSDLKTVQHQIEAQKKEYNALQEKIALWRDVLRQKKESCAQKQAVLNERLRNRMLLREKTRVLCIEAQRVFPVIMDQTVRELKSVFTNSEQQKNYDQKAIDALERI